MMDEIKAIESREPSDPTLTVSQYLASQASEAGSVTDAGPTERSLVARLCLETTALFRFLARRIVTGAGVPGGAATSIRRSCARLKLWSDGYGVSEGRLDEILAKSGKIRRATGKGVASIAKTLSERMFERNVLPMRDTNSASQDLWDLPKFQPVWTRSD
jgi:hypothetical protein